ncbi:hypothetical protein J437_LFUL001801 [Ladona fulva]|uniref:Uncharacterized protein n=1 Tax=Ladona fulva TaxID=123851 RepID=A0A8K0NWC8_LADFU|nr:hypothetical protein J437_LFUL001801 [Ladona fulva]
MEQEENILIKNTAFIYLPKISDKEILSSGFLTYINSYVFIHLIQSSEGLPRALVSVPRTKIVEGVDVVAVVVVVELVPVVVVAAVVAPGTPKAGTGPRPILKQKKSREQPASAAQCLAEFVGEHSMLEDLPLGFSAICCIKLCIPGVLSRPPVLPPGAFEPERPPLPSEEPALPLPPPPPPPPPPGDHGFPDAPRYKNIFLSPGMDSRFDMALSWLLISSCNIEGFLASSIACRSRSGLFRVHVMGSNNDDIYITDYYYILPKQ